MSKKTIVFSEPVELDQRTNDGLTVTLLWNAAINEVTLQLDDHGATGSAVIPGHLAADAFWHPFCYVAELVPATLPEASAEEPVAGDDVDAVAGDGDEGGEKAAA